MKPILVLGMHRSGTSCLAGILQFAGLELGQVFTQNPHNARGNRENAAVMALNEAVLAYNQASWDQPRVARRFSAEHCADRGQILQSLESLADGGRFGFKDPRALFTLPFWAQAQAFDFIGSFRHPLAVAQSLQQRNRFALEQGLALWQRYNQRLLELHAARPFPIVEYGVGTAAYRQQLELALAELGFPAQSRARGLDFFTPALEHQSATANLAALSEPVRTLYMQLGERRVRPAEV